MLWRWTHDLKPSLVIGDSYTRTVCEVFQKILVLFPADLLENQHCPFRQVLDCVPIFRRSSAHTSIVSRYVPYAAAWLISAVLILSASAGAVYEVVGNWLDACRYPRRGKSHHA